MMCVSLFAFFIIICWATVPVWKRSKTPTLGPHRVA